MRKFDISKPPGQRTFIFLNLNVLAECALSGFKGEGRGMVMVDTESDNELLALAEFCYVRLRLLVSKYPTFEGSKEERMVRDYDPKTEWVVTFAGSDNLDSYRIRMLPSGH